jgi:hypothetical protein
MHTSYLRRASTHRSAPVWVVGALFVILGLLLLPSAGWAAPPSAVHPSPVLPPLQPESIARVPAQPDQATGPPVSTSNEAVASPAASYAGWGNMTPYLAQSPGPRTGAAMAYDANSSDGYLVLFGGEGPTGVLGDTWTYQSGVWHNVTPSTITPTNSPSARFGAAIAYDPSDGYLVLFGGSTGPYTGSSSPLLNDTWVFDGGAWTEVCSACAPAARLDASATEISATGGIVMFGGLGIQSGAYKSLNDSWTFTSGGWTALTPAASPPARFGSSGAWDPAAAAVTLFGGCSRSLVTPDPTCASVLNDSWQYAGGNWVRIATGSLSPPGRWAAGLASPPPPSSPILFGGESAVGRLDDTWQESSGEWSDLSAGLLQAPSPREGFSLAFDNSTGDGYFLIFGGTNGTYLNETWVYPSPFNPLRVTAPDANTTTLDAGQQLVLNVTIAGGAGKNTITWFGLPSGCLPANATKINCRPGTPSGAPTTSSISVRVRDKLGSIAWSTSTDVTVNPIPAVGIAGAPTNVGAPPLSITLTATALWGTPPFVYAWQFGDGASGTGNPVTHQYLSVGRYLVTVWANDSVGGSVSAHYPVSVVGPLTELVEIVPSNSVSPGTAVTLQVYVRGGTGPYMYAWTGLPSACGHPPGSNVTCTLETPGAYNVTVTVTDAFGNRTTASVAFTVTGPWYDSPWLWAGVALVIVVAIAVAAALVLRRRRGPRRRLQIASPPPPAGPS